jgi:phenylpropionate dioxygenase-like ring-hydroxylating dioxygenase large terminal subunit
MVSREENELLTRVEGDAPLGRLMRDNYWIPFALSDHLAPGDAPSPIRLFGENYVAFRAQDGRIGFLDELCPHRRASLLLARVEENAVRCIYHGWKLDVSGRVVEAPTQTVRHDQFCERVKVTHFPVHEAGGMVWVWLGGTEAPAFPDLPFGEAHGVNVVNTFSIMPCNWLQGFEGGFDSVHGPILHQSIINDMVQKKSGSMDVGGVRSTIAAPPNYETELAPYGLRAASLRPAGDGQTYVRTSHWFFPFVIVVPNGYAGLTHIFAFAPVDDTHHLLFFGNYGDAPMSEAEVAGLRDGFVADPRNYVALQGDRSNRWGQDRELMRAGNFTGIARSAIDEDAAVQVSMGPVSDRTGENLSSSDGAIAQARRVILDSIATVAAGGLPPGSALTEEGVKLPQPFEATLGEGDSWRDLQPVA